MRTLVAELGVEWQDGLAADELEGCTGKWVGCCDGDGDGMD